MAQIAEIVKVEAPASAAAGGQVIVDVHVKNLALAPGGYNDIAVSGVYDSTQLPFQFDYLNVAPQETVVFRGWFTMSSKKVRVWVWSWYWDGSKWVQDDEKYVDISLTELKPEFSDMKISNFIRV